MAYSENLATRVREALAHLPEVEEKKMFRGLTFMVDGKMCISISGDRIMCRINQNVHEDAIKREGCEAVIMRGREYKGFVYVNQEAIKTKKDFHYWVGLALDFNKIAKASKKSKG